MTRHGAAITTAGLGGALASAALLGGCAIPELIAGMGQNYEYQRLKEVLPEYEGLENETFAVLVDADLATLYEHQFLIEKVASGVAMRIHQRVPGARMVSPDLVVQWQYQTPQWNAMPLADVATQLGANRIVHIDIREYRLNPPGNRFLWEGVCEATVGIVERDGVSPDMFAETFTIRSEYPGIDGVGRESATAGQIEMGLLQTFIRATSELFYKHLRPKYPDRYQGPMPNETRPT